MDFVTEAYSYASKNGKIILRACIDRPSNSAHSAFDYLNSYTNSIHSFVNDRLFWDVQEAYDRSIRESIRFLPFLYTFDCSVIYFDDVYLSCVMLVKLTQATNIISQAVDSVVFVNDQILPPKLVHFGSRNKKLLFDSDGFPSVVELEREKIVFRRVGKNNISK